MVKKGSIAICLRAAVVYMMNTVVDMPVEVFLKVTEEKNQMKSHFPHLLSFSHWNNTNQ